MQGERCFQYASFRHSRQSIMSKDGKAFNRNPAVILENLKILLSYNKYFLVILNNCKSVSITNKIRQRSGGISTTAPGFPLERLLNLLIIERAGLTAGWWIYLWNIDKNLELIELISVFGP